MMTHDGTPANDTGEANAARIVMAVNNFDELVRAVTMAAQVWGQVLAKQYDQPAQEVREPILNALRAVLSKCTPEEQPDQPSSTAPLQVDGGNK